MPSHGPGKELLLSFPGMWPFGEAADTDGFCMGEDLAGASGKRCRQDKGHVSWTWAISRPWPDAFCSFTPRGQCGKFAP